MKHGVQIENGGKYAGRGCGKQVRSALVFPEHYSCFIKRGIFSDIVFEVLYIGAVPYRKDSIFQSVGRGTCLLQHYGKYLGLSAHHRPFGVNDAAALL